MIEQSVNATIVEAQYRTSTVPFTTLLPKNLNSSKFTLSKVGKSASYTIHSAQRIVFLAKFLAMWLRCPTLFGHLLGNIAMKGWDRRTLLFLEVRSIVVLAYELFSWNTLVFLYWHTPNRGYLFVRIIAQYIRLLSIRMCCCGICPGEGWIHWARDIAIHLLDHRESCCSTIHCLILVK